MSGLQLRTYGPLASMTFAIGLANQINALAKRFGNHGLCLTGMSSRGVIVVAMHLALDRRRLRRPIRQIAFVLGCCMFSSSVFLDKRSAFGQQCPDDPGHLVSQRYGCHFGWSTFQ